VPEEKLEVGIKKDGTDYMTWEEMYNESLETIRELYEEIEVLRAIVRVQLPIIGDKDE
jgi:hypothetical protein